MPNNIFDDIVKKSLTSYYNLQDDFCFLENRIFKVKESLEKYFDNEFTISKNSKHIILLFDKSDILKVEYSSDFNKGKYKYSSSFLTFCSHGSREDIDKYAEHVLMDYAFIKSLNKK